MKLDYWAFRLPEEGKWVDCYLVMRYKRKTLYEMYVEGRENYFDGIGHANKFGYRPVRKKDLLTVLSHERTPLLRERIKKMILDWEKIKDKGIRV